MATIVHGRQISRSEAETIASDFIHSGSVLLQSPGATVCKTLGYETNREDYQPYYIFNVDDNQGFVIVSGDDRSQRILGYSDTGSLDFDNMPPQLVDLLKQYAQQIKAITANTPAHPSWNTTAGTSSSSGTVVLKTVNWGQGEPFNSKCPVVGENKTLTGCVATAMAIVMKYHNWPQKGRGQHRYFDMGTGTTSYFDFSDCQIDWDNISDEYTSDSSARSIEAVSNLMYAAGQAVEMMYYPLESGAFFPFVAPYLRYHFLYDINCEYLESEDFSTEEWENRIRNEINSGRPIIYQGSGMGDHAFVCDGYDDNNMFHFNWGWNGSSNGFYLLDALDPEYFNFSNKQSMIVGIMPDKSGKDISPAFVDQGYAYDDCGVSTGSFISVTNVEKNVPFDFNCRILTVPFGFDGYFGLALTDAEGHVKELLAHTFYNKPQNNTWPFDIIFENCKLSEDPDATDLIQLVSKKTSENQWLPVPGTSKTPTSLPVNGNVVKSTTLNISVENSSGTVRTFNRDLETGSYSVLAGNKLFISGIYSSIAKVTHNNKTQIYYWNKNTTYEIALEEGEYSVELMSRELYKEKITLENSGTLNDKIGLPSAHFIEELTVEGRINANDLFFIRDNCGYLKKLDLTNTEIDELSVNDMKYLKNELPPESFNGLNSLNSVKLPVNLVGIGTLALARTSIAGIEIPVSVQEITTDAFQDVYSLKTVLVHWHVPTELAESFQNTGCYNDGTLFVPTGTKGLYETSSWNFFSNIIEKESMDLDFIEFTTDGLSYNLWPSSATATIVGFTSDLFKNLIIPEKITYEGNEYTVSIISKEAFIRCGLLETCIIPNTVLSIGESAFAECENLREIKFGEKVKELPTGCFTCCYKLEKADIPDNILFIGWGAFDGCRSLKTVHIHKDLQLHPNGSYYGLSSCNTITLDNTNPYYKVVDNILYSKDMKHLILCAGAIKGIINIPDGVESLSWRAFYDMPNLTEVNLPNSITDIGYQFVNLCPMLKHIAIPDMVVGTDSETIGDCGELESLTLGRNFRGGSGIRNNKKLKHIFLRNTNKIDIPIIFRTGTQQDDVYRTYIFYTDQIKPNASLDKCEAFYVPGGCEKDFEGIADCNIKPLWDYKIDRINNRLCISPLLESLTIDNVTINGLPAKSISKNIYSVDDSSDLNVIVDFTLLDRQKMTTVYDSAFNALIPDSNISGFNYITTDTSDRVTVYNLQGIVMAENVIKAELEKLKPGIYIVLSGSKISKIVIR